MSEYMKHMMEIEAVKKEADDLMINKINYYEKEIALIKEDHQIDMLNQIKRHADIVFEKDNRIRELEIINKEHQEINGKLRLECDVLNKLREKGAL